MNPEKTIYPNLHCKIQTVVELGLTKPVTNQIRERFIEIVDAHILTDREQVAKLDSETDKLRFRLVLNYDCDDATHSANLAKIRDRITEIKQKLRNMLMAVDLCA